MRQIVALGSSWRRRWPGSAALAAAWLVATGACFEESDPVDETGAMQSSSSSSECVAGTEGCPCIDGECVGALECYSNVCVDAGSTSAATTNAETTASAEATTEPATTTMGTTPMTSSMTTDGPLDEGPMTTDVGGDLPQGDPCDPFFDLCQAGLACVGIGMEGLVCDVPGPGMQGDSCDLMLACGPGFLCMQADVLPMCGSLGCCSAMCDLTAMGGCPPGLVCEPFYPEGQAPPGNEHIGVCVFD